MSADRSTRGGQVRLLETSAWPAICRYICRSSRPPLGPIRRLVRTVRTENGTESWAARLLIYCGETRVCFTGESLWGGGLVVKSISPHLPPAARPASSNLAPPHVTWFTSQGKEDTCPPCLTVSQRNNSASCSLGRGNFNILFNTANKLNLLIQQNSTIIIFGLVLSRKNEFESL